MSHVIRAPFPGVFYRQPNPDEAPFVSESDAVAPGTVIGLIEVMKMFQEVHADATGDVAEFLVENEALVEAGQPLVRLS
jgi:acetyl-CoA carboxylase biotin carboxyl carrier protein